MPSVVTWKKCTIKIQKLFLPLFRTLLKLDHSSRGRWRFRSNSSTCYCCSLDIRRHTIVSATMTIMRCQCTEGDFYYEGINKSFPYFQGDFGTQIKMLEMGYGTPGDGSGGFQGTFWAENFLVVTPKNFRENAIFCEKWPKNAIFEAFEPDLWLACTCHSPRDSPKVSGAILGARQVLGEPKTGPK